ncbi:hypothetical protein GCM10011521_18950 [Arenimonas soli]|uniref:DUF4034 domain-containing protein n=1 Tax=Arenimonas soli TaxID=2269504 RepID=A0ABQ1HKY0_9GAMM|nr:hypothetical protein [Arenimonas soli]GGA80849.1 hypothetical protein GCM10011521_18950 [Arenimonas soli]
MFKYLTLALLVLIGPAAAQTRDPEAANIDARIQLAAANAQGDAISDAVLARATDMQRGYGAVDDIDPALLQDLQAAHGKLQARTEAMMRKEPVLLATFSGCFWRWEVPARCEGVREDLAELAGDNAYHHFVLMADAGRREDDAAFARHALNVAAATEYRPDFQQVFASLNHRYRQVPDMLWMHEENTYGAAASGVHAMALAAAVALPAYQQFMNACRDSEGERRELCLLVARRLAAESPVVMDRMIGFALLEKKGDARDQAQALEWKREVDWLTQGVVGYEEELSPEQFNTYFDLFSTQGEIAAMIYANQVRGRPVEPPADWQP